MNVPNGYSKCLSVAKVLLLSCNSSLHSELKESQNIFEVLKPLKLWRPFIKSVVQLNSLSNFVAKQNPVKQRERERERERERLY